MEEIKKYLRQYIVLLNLELDALDDVIAHRLAKIGPQSPRFSDMPKGTGGQRDTMLDYICSLDEKENKYINIRSQRIALKDDIEWLFAGLSNDEKMILRLRYLSPVPIMTSDKLVGYRRYSWQDIDGIMQISHSKSLKTHRNALKNIKKCLKNV